MENRFALIRFFLIPLLIAGGFFISAHPSFAGSFTEAHRMMGDAMMDAYTVSVKAPLTNEERAWILAGMAHEGIPARALRHNEASVWMHDAIRQSSPIYDGVYTWEEGIYDYARGDTERAFKTLGHILHLVIDKHPAACIFFASTPGMRSWKEILQEEHTRAVAAVKEESTETMRQFFIEARAAEELAKNNAEYLAALKPATPEDMFVVILTRAIAMMRDEGRTALVLLARVFERTVPPFASGAQSVLPSRAEALAEEQTTNEETIHVQQKPLLPLAHSVIALLPAHEAPAPVYVPTADALAGEILVDTQEQPRESPIELLPPYTSRPTAVAPPPEELDEFGFPIGTHHSYDRTPPVTALATKPESTTNQAQATFTFSSTKSGSFSCIVDGSVESACASPVSYANLLEGTHTFTVRARDFLGIDDATPETYTWTIDTTVPDTTFVSGPGILMNSRTALFVFSGSEQNVTFGYTLDNGAWQAVVSPLTLADISDGTHTVIIRAIDAAGNSDATPATATWTVDATPPASPTLTSPTTGTSYTTTAASVILVGTREADAVITINDSIDGITLPTETTWQKTIDLALGQTTVVVKATDAAGNMSAPLTITITRNENQSPMTIANLAITTPITTHDRLALTWTTPSDPDQPANELSYALRYAVTSITDEMTWSGATPVAGLPLVGTAGSQQTFTVTDLSPATAYVFALRTFDGTLFSGLSNNATGTTHYGVRITDAHFAGGVNEEYMGITNERSDTQDLTGWTLYDSTSLASHTYTFPSFSLASGATVKVHTGVGANTATNLYWNKASSVWNDDGDTATIKNNSGVLIDTITWQ